MLRSINSGLNSDHFYFGCVSNTPRRMKNFAPFKNPIWAYQQINVVHNAYKFDGPFLIKSRYIRNVAHKTMEHEFQTSWESLLDITSTRVGAQCL